MSTCGWPPLPDSGPVWVGTSWKMNHTLAEAVAYAEQIAALRPAIPAAVEMFVVPPFTALDRVAAILRGTGIRVGAQNAHWAPAGAYTGEISVPMAADAGASLIELGHSERRAGFGETDETVNRKVHAVLAAGLRPLVCVGEPRSERRSGTATEYVVRQVKLALDGVRKEDLAAVLLAYEPVWAIGEGADPAAVEDVVGMHTEIRRALSTAFGEGGRAIPVLYGGSVSGTNAATLIREEEVDGLFIGRAAWTADGYEAILRAVTSALDEEQSGGPCQSG